MIIKIIDLTGFEYLIHGSHNLAFFNATTYAQLISNAGSQTQDWHQDYAPKTDQEWENYYKKCEELKMTPISVIYSLDGFFFFCII